MSPFLKKNLINVKSVFFREKYRFDQGNAFLVFLNFSMLVISLVKQNRGSENMVFWYILMGFSGTWLLGYFLDKVVKVQDASERVAVKRSHIWKTNFNHHNELSKKLDEIDSKIEKLEKIIDSRNENLD